MTEKIFCGKLIKQIGDELQKNGNNAMRAQNMTMVQTAALLEINASPAKQLSLKELEQRLHVAQSTMAGIAARLEQKGLVVGVEDDSDRRVKLVHITPAGLECVLAAQKGMIEAEEKLLACLTETEQKIFYTLLKKVRDSLQ